MNRGSLGETQNYRSAIQKKRQSLPLHSGLQSVSRALDLMDIFPAHGPEIGLSDLAALLSMNKATLEPRGYVQRSVGSRKYGLGVRLFELGAQFQNQLDIRRAASPELTSMVEETREGRHYVRI